MHLYKKILNFSTPFLPYSFLKKIYNGKTIFPFYHTVSDNELPHVKNLYNVRNIKQFKKDLDFLTKHYEAISIYDFIKKNKNYNKPQFILSFDDGLSEIYHIIAPILLKRKIPAIFFVNSDFIDNRNLFFKHKISLIIENIKTNNENKKIISDFFPHKKNIQKYLISLQFHDNQIIDKIAKLLKINFTEYLTQNKPYLNIKQIIKLKKQGFTIGAHSVNHPLFNQISFEEKYKQTKESLDFVKNTTKEEKKLFAFPFTDFGVEKKFFEKIYSENIVDFSFGTAGLKMDKFSQNIQRIPVENHNTALNSFKYEHFYFLLKKFANKNTIYRK